MFSNATLTLWTRGDSIDEDTGYRTTGTQTFILQDAPCVFSQRSGAKRSVNADGLRDYVKPIFSVILHGNKTIEIPPGTQAQVTCAGVTNIFTVNHAVLTQGIGAAHWEIDVERVVTP